jgi:hypothetical protein
MKPSWVRWRLCAAASLLGVALSALGDSNNPVSDSPDQRLYAGDTFLGLENGSLIESIYFRAAWLKLHPEADAIILVTSPGGKDGKYPPVAAVTVYTKTDGRVWAHSTDYGSVLLDTIKPDDLKKNTAQCLDVYFKTVAKLPSKPRPVIGEVDGQVQLAFDAVHDPKILPYFPVAIMDIPGSTRMPDGTSIESDSKALVFDWNDAHYMWQPSTGALREDPPKDPLTGRPFLCVKHGDLVESLVFIHDYERVHPEEKATLLFAPQDFDHGMSSAGLAAAAYTVNGTVHVRGYFSPDFVPTTQSHSFKPADLDDPEAMARLYQLYQESLFGVFKEAYARAHPHGPMPKTIHGEIYDTLCPEFPQSLPGDTAEMQANRVFQRATDDGIVCLVDLVEPFGRLVVLHWRMLRCCYTGDWKHTGKPASYYDGIWDPNDPNRLIEAILFAHDFKPEQPGDSVVVLPYRQFGLWDMVQGIAVYTRGGKVYAHNPAVGDAPMPDTRPADLADLANPDKSHTVRLAANGAIHTIDKAKVFENTAALEKQLDRELQSWIQDQGSQNDKWGIRRHVFEMVMRPADLGNVEVTSVYEKLKAAGIDCQLHATTKGRGPDGKITEEARPCVSFTFQGVRYTYGPEYYCSAADNLVLDP